MILDQKNEVWKPVVGFEKEYAVSSFGRVKNIKKGKLKPVFIHPKTGYCMLMLSGGKNKYVHRLVAESFHPLSEFIGAQVNHKDGNKQNNYYQNLEWVTRSENIRHGFRIGTIKSNLRGKFLSLNSKAKAVVAIKDTAIIEFGTVKECCEHVGGAYNHICNYIVDSGKEFRGYLIYSL
jgi:hypothetical protein